MGHGDISLEGARAAAARGELGDWVAQFLSSPGSDNAPLAAELSERLGWWVGPVQVPLDRLLRLAGPPGAPALVTVEDEHWDDRVDEMAEQVEEGWEPPPAVATYREGELHLEDGNHRVESLRQAGEHRAWVVIGFESEDDAAQFDADEVTASEAT